MNTKKVTLIGVGLAAGLLLGWLGFSSHFLPESKNAQDPSVAASTTATAPTGNATANPKIEEGLSPDWCAEHRVPESECTECHPALIANFKAKGDWCGEHKLPESHCRLCNPGQTFAQEPKIESHPDESYRPSVFFPRNAARCVTDDAIIQFASAETAQRAGLTLVPALEVIEASAAEAPAEVLFDETRSYVMTTTIPALVVRWLVEPGQDVLTGQAVAELESPEMPRLKSDYLESLSEAELRQLEFERADSLVARGLISTAETQQIASQFKTAKARLAGALGQIEACGLSPDDVQAIQSRHSVSPRWLLRATRSGALLERKAVLGELRAAGSSFALIGDPSVLWIEAQVRESDLSLFRRGQAVEFATDGDALHKVSGQVIWVAQYVDPATRSATVRAHAANGSLDLKAHQFGRLMLPLRPQSGAVAVPRDAVQWEGCCNVVFVQEAPDRFRPRKVTVSRGDRGYYNVSSGLQAGDMVVVKGSYLLKTELKKGSLGAGCCDVAPKS